MIGKENQIKHRARWLFQLLDSPDVGIIGGYHCGNLGDLALGYSLQNFLSGFSNASSGLQTIYNLNKWPSAQFAILGGGAIAYVDCLNKVSRRYKDNPEKVSIIGVDFEDEKVFDKHIEFLRSVSSISCRSKEQANYVSEKLARSDVSFHQDLCFSLPLTAPKPSISETSKVVGFNMVPFFARLNKSGNFEKDYYLLHSTRTKFNKSIDFENLPNAYIHYFKKVIKYYAEKGYKLVHIPFTLEDDIYARTMLRELDVNFLRYSTNINRILLIFLEFEFFLSSRFHSLVFSLITRTPVIPFLYAEKCQRLVQDLAMNFETTVTPSDLLGNKEELIERIVSQKPVFVGSGWLCNEKEKIYTHLSSVLEKLLN
jgi:hypothetical protein